MPTEDSLITSKDILARTNISRATLNNYIRMGILSKPIVQPPMDSIKGPRKIGYFPRESISIIESVKRLKKSGLSMEDIAAKLMGPDHGRSDLKDRTAKTSRKAVEKPQTLALFPEMDLSASPKTEVRITKEKVISPAAALPALLPICVLHAAIEDSVKLSDEMTPEAYCTFMEDVCRTFASICGSYGGICGTAFVSAPSFSLTAARLF